MPLAPVVLTIGGFDPSSGAGVTADIKTIAAHRCYGVACVTALTIQSTRGVKRLAATPASVVRDTLRELVDDLPPKAIHIGMLANGEVAEAVADFVEETRPPNLVLDPIVKSSSGADLLDVVGIDVLRRRLLGRVAVVTPNLDEASVLSGLTVGNLDEMRAAARQLHGLGAKAVVVKGGHLLGEQTVDLLSFCDAGGIHQEEFAGPRLDSRSTHGTGCAFSTALACNLALGRPLPEGVAAAKEFVATAIERAQPLGHGRGPMNLLFPLD